MYTASYNYQSPYTYTPHSARHNKPVKPTERSSSDAYPGQIEKHQQQGVSKPTSKYRHFREHQVRENLGAQVTPVQLSESELPSAGNSRVSRSEAMAQLETYIDYTSGADQDLGAKYRKLGAINLESELAAVKAFQQGAIASASKAAQATPEFKAATTALKTINGFASLLKDSSEAGQIAIDKSIALIDETISNLSRGGQNADPIYTKARNQLIAARKQYSTAFKVIHEVKEQLKNIDTPSADFERSYFDKVLPNKLKQAKEQLRNATDRFEDARQSVKARAESVKNAFKRGSQSAKDALPFLKMAKGLASFAGFAGDAMSLATSIWDVAFPTSQKVDISTASNNDDLIRAQNTNIAMNRVRAEADGETLTMRTSALQQTTSALAPSSGRRWLQLANMLSERHAVDNFGASPLFGDKSPTQYSTSYRDFGNAGIAPLSNEINAGSVVNPISPRSNFPGLIGEPALGGGSPTTNILGNKRDIGALNRRLNALSSQVYGSNYNTEHTISNASYDALNALEATEGKLEDYTQAASNQVKATKAALNDLMAEAGYAGTTWESASASQKLSALHKLTELANGQSNDPNAFGVFYDTRLNGDKGEVDMQSLEKNTQRLVAAADNVVNQLTGRNNVIVQEAEQFTQTAREKIEDTREDLLRQWASSSAIKIGTEYVKPEDALNYLGFAATQKMDNSAEAAAYVNALFSEDNKFVEMLYRYNQYAQKNPSLEAIPLRANVDVGQKIIFGGTYRSTTDSPTFQGPDEARQYYREQWLTELRKDVLATLKDNGLYSDPAYDMVKNPITSEWSYISYPASKPSYPDFSSTVLM